MCGGRKFTEFQLDALEAHNDYRSRHDAPLMELNLALCDYSTEWANVNLIRFNYLVAIMKVIFSALLIQTL